MIPEILPTGLWDFATSVADSLGEKISHAGADHEHDTLEGCVNNKLCARAKHI